MEKHRDKLKKSRKRKLPERREFSKSPNRIKATKLTAQAKKGKQGKDIGEAARTSDLEERKRLID